MFVPPSLYSAWHLSETKTMQGKLTWLFFFGNNSMDLTISHCVYTDLVTPFPPLYPFLLAARWNRMRLANRVGDIHKSKSIPWFLAFWQSNHVVPWGVLIYGEREGDSQQTYVLLQRNSHEHLWVAHFAHDGPLGKSSLVTAILVGENYCPYPYQKLDCHFVQVFVLNQHLEDVRPQQEKTWRGEVPKFEEWGLK